MEQQRCTRIRASACSSIPVLVSYCQSNIPPVSDSPIADTPVARRRVVIDSDSDSDGDFQVPHQRKAASVAVHSSVSSASASSNSDAPVVKRRAPVIDSDDDDDWHHHRHGDKSHGDSENIRSGNERSAATAANAASDRLAAILSELSLHPVPPAVASPSVAGGDAGKQHGSAYSGYPMAAPSSTSVSTVAAAAASSAALVDMPLTERKLAFNAAVRDGKAHEAAANWAGALVAYGYAAALFPARDDLGIAKKLASLRRKIEVQRAELEARPVDDWFRGTDAEVFMPFEPVSALTAADSASSSAASAAASCLSSSSCSSSTAVPPAGPVFRLPRDVHAQLYNYQRACLHWLWRLHCGGAGTGGVLGDDMGLGKTVQIAAFLRGLFHSRLAHAVLLVAPVSGTRSDACSSQHLKIANISIVIDFHRTPHAFSGQVSAIFSTLLQNLFTNRLLDV